jgi:N,N'-diacetyllegionaminate synthase
MELILEFCQNHNGDENILDKMLESAAESGASIVKLQCAFADDLSFRAIFEEGTPSGILPIQKRPYSLEYKRLKPLELSFDVLERFVRRAKEFNLTPCITAFSYKHINALVNCGFNTIKIASYDCASDVLLEKCAENFDRLIVSTGATYDFEIENCAHMLSKRGTNFSLLHCVTLYPTQISDAHISRMSSLRSLCPSVGYSDHYGRAGSKDINLLTKVAIHEGADLIERHFTILEEDETKDGPVSIKPADVIDIQTFGKLTHEDQRLHLNEIDPEWKISLGNAKRQLSIQELANREYYRGRFMNPISKDILGYPIGRYNWERWIEV